MLGEELVLVSAAVSPYLAIMQAVADPHQRPPASLLPELHEHGQVALHAVRAIMVPVTWYSTVHYSTLGRYREGGS